MRNFLLIAGIVCFLSFLPVRSFADKQYVEIFRNEDAVVSLKTDSVKDMDGYVSAVIKKIPRGQYLREWSDIAGDQTSYILFSCSFSKELKRMKLNKCVVYDKSGSAINSYDTETFLWEDIAPGTTAELEYDFVMELYKNIKN
jgi:hypothetical protein